MVEHQIDIQIEESLGEVGLDTRILQHTVELTLARHQIAEPCEIVVVLTDDAAIHDLNLRFRGVDRPTDVLAFPNESRGPFSGGASGFPRYLGDVVIALPQAQVQAEAAGGTLVEELQLLVVHGTLHLLGYDHEQPADHERMWAVQAKLLRDLNIHIPLPE